MPGEAPARILFCDHTAKLGGGEIALCNLLERIDRAKFRPLAALSEDGSLRGTMEGLGVEVDVMPLDPRVRETRKDSLGVRGLSGARSILMTAAYAVRLARYMKAQQIELVHCNSLKADLYGGLAARLARRPVIWHVRDRIVPEYLPAPAVRFFRRMARIVPTAVITNSHATLAELRLSENRPPAFVVWEGVLPDNYDQAAQSPVFVDGALRVGLIGRIAPWKGQDVFVKAAVQVYRQFPNARFLVIGAPLFGEHDYEADVKKLAIDLGVSESVEFTGFRRDVPAMMRDLDIVVHASTTGEPFGKVIIEGMAACRPVVATDGGAVPEIVEDGKTGFLVPMGDADKMAEAILRLARDPELCRRMGAAGRQRVMEVFHVNRMVRDVEQIFTKVLAMRKGQ